MLFSFTCHAVSFTLLTISWLLLPNFVADTLSKLAFLGSFLFVSYTIGNFFDLLPRFTVPGKDKAVFITGCDSGFGHLLAHRLDSIGFKVFAGCLSITGEGAVRLRDSSSSRLTLVEVDVTNDESVKKAHELVVENLQDLTFWALVNNAGIITRGELEWTSLDEYRKQFEVNTFGTVRVTQTFLPLLRRSKGRVVATTSFGGRYTFSGFASYCMTKHATNSFCDGLRMEMEKFGVDVITVEPFSYRTPMTKLSTILQSAEATWSKAPNSLKEDYGEGYFNAFKQSVEMFNELSASSNVHDVTHSLVEAVTVTSPHYSYTVGDLKSLLLFWFVRRLPPWIGKFVVRKFVTHDCHISEYLEDSEMKKKAS